jgi:hypothetical protein
MSKPIKCNVVLTSVRTRRDNSLGLSIETPELDNDAMLVFLRLRGINLDMTLEPMGQELEAPIEVKARRDERSPALRQRNILFVWFKYEQECGRLPKDYNFEVFYAEKIEKNIEYIKTKLPDQT